MESTFTSAGWDFYGETANGIEDIWRMIADGEDYPKLSWQFTDGDLMLSPSTIVRSSRSKTFTALLYLPLGIGKDQIDANEPIKLYPGGLKARLMQIYQSTKENQPSIKVFMMFSKDELTAAMPNDSRFELTIAGKFKSGQYFVGSDFMTIKK